MNEAKKLKELSLILSFPDENEIVGDIELELLMMNGYFATPPSTCPSQTLAEITNVFFTSGLGLNAE